MNRTWIGIGLCALVLLTAGCSATQPRVNSPVAEKPHYMDEGATITVEDPAFAGSEGEGLSVLERLKKVTEDLNVECEKNALLAQELVTMREARDALKADLDAARADNIRITEESARLKLQLSDQTTRLDASQRERRDLLEKLVNLKIEKTKVEKELLKIKIAALSGEG
jgi:hypothetical protein